MTRRSGNPTGGIQGASNTGLGPQPSVDRHYESLVAAFSGFDDTALARIFAHDGLLLTSATGGLHGAPAIGLWFRRQFARARKLGVQLRLGVELHERDSRPGLVCDRGSFTVSWDDGVRSIPAYRGKFLAVFRPVPGRPRDFRADTVSCLPSVLRLPGQPVPQLAN